MLKHFRAKASLLVIACSSCFAAHAIAEQARQINVPAGDLIPALKSLAGQSGAEFVYRSEDLEGLRTRGVSGNLTSQEAVRKLLEGTNLVLTEDASGAVLVAPRGASRPLASPDNEDSGARRTSDSFRLAQVAQGQIAVSAAETSTPSARESGQLEEIVVTAERRREDVQKTATSVAVRSGDALQAEGKFTLQQMLEDVAGVTALPSSSSFNSASSGLGITIRGVTGNTSITSVSPPATTAVYTDGVYEGIGGNYDVERVEVLRGPQGTLYGRSATAGVVATHTRAPQLGEFGANVLAELGNYNLQHYSAAVNLPAGETLAFRVAADKYGRDGYDSAEGGKVDRLSTRVKALYKPIDALSILVGAASEDNKTHSGGVTATRSSPDNFVYSSAPVFSGKNDFRQYWAEINWDFGLANLTYLPAYRKWHQGAQPSVATLFGLAYANTTERPADKYVTHELRLASKDDSWLKWQVGAFVYNNRMNYINTIRWILSGNLLTNNFIDKKTDAWGMFSEATLPFTDATRLTAGVRYDFTEVQSSITTLTNLNALCYSVFATTGQGCLANPVPAPNTNLLGSPEAISFNSLSGDAGTNRYYNFTYKVRLEHDFTPSNLVYAMISTGFLPGDVQTSGGNGGTVSVSKFATETLTAYEIGSKNRFLDDSLQANVGLFYYNYGGLQTRVNPDGNPTTAYMATIPARMYGGEFELLYQLTPKDRISFSYALTNARYRDVNSVPPNYNIATTAISQEQVATVVPQTATLGYDHTFDLPGGSKLVAHGDVRHLSGRYITDLDPQEIQYGAWNYVHVKADDIANLNLGWMSSTGRISVTGYVRNVFDNRYPVSTAFTTSASGVTTISGSQYDPRTYGAVLSVNF